MKAIVLCAGRGTRLRPLTHSLAKHLIPVANKPVLFHGLENLATAGLRDVAIVVNRETREQIEAAVGNGERFGIAVTFLEQHQALGLAHAVRCARDFVGDDPFLLYLGDTILPQGVGGVTELFRRERPNAVLTLAEVAEPSRYGIAEVDGERVVRLVEKPPHPRSNLAVVGAYVFDHRIFEAIDRLRPSARNEYEITDAIQGLIDRGGSVRYHRLAGWWKDAGKPEDLLEANRELLARLEPRIEGAIDEGSSITGTAVIGAGSEIRHSRIVGPVVIGRGVHVADAVVGPYVALGDGADVREAHVEESIVLAGASIRHLGGRLCDSLLGRNVRLTGAGGGSEALRLIVGDDGSVDFR